MGFGGINAHVVLESLVDRRRTTVNAVEHGRLVEGRAITSVLKKSTCHSKVETLAGSAMMVS
jgi:acyl transferase domain-containing protein